MDRSSFIRGLLDDQSDPQLPQSVPQNDFGPRAYGLLNALFPDPYEASGEAVQQFRAGNPIDAFMTMYGAMPATGALKNVSKAAKAAETVSEAAPQGIIAYHGSPHSFDRFDMSKIGTGEGAQAYGHGLYFAQNEDVAKQYREFLSSRNNDLTDPGNLAASLLYRTPEGTREAAIREAQAVINSVDRMPAAYKHDPGVRERTQRALELLQSGAELPKQGGSMYQVRINADPEHFLDYEKPLSAQSPVLQDLVAKIPAAPDRASWPHITGNDLHEQLRVDAMGDDAFMGSSGYRMQRRNEAAVDVAKALREAGIPGIKYLDQGSRGAGEGSRNYVVFDDNLVEILKKYGLVGLLGGGAAMGASQSPNAQQSAPLL